MDAYIFPYRGGDQRRVEVVRDYAGQTHPIIEKLRQEGTALDPVLGDLAVALTGVRLGEMYEDIVTNCTVHVGADPTGPTGLLHETAEQYFLH